MRLFFVPFVIKEHEGKLTKKRSFYRVMLYNMNTQSAIHNLQFADCRLPIADCRLPTADCRLPTADCRLPTADCRLPTVDCYGITENSKPLQVPYGKWAGLLQKVFVLYERFFSLK